VNIKLGDKVIVNSGADKGKTGEILKIIKNAKTSTKVIVQDVNKRRRHRRASYDQAAGIVEIHKPIDISNVSLIDPKTKQATRIGYQTDTKGTKKRVARKSGKLID